MATVYGVRTHLKGGCGMNYWHRFTSGPTSPYDEPGQVRKLLKDWETGGANFLGCGFTETELSKEAYKQLVKLYGKPACQTPAQINKNSGNKFFFAIWSTVK